MAEEGDYKTAMYHAVGIGLCNTKDKVGEKFWKVHSEILKSELENRRHEYQGQLAEIMNSILGEISLIKVLNEELEIIEKRLRALDEGCIALTGVIAWKL
jgi:hypothetical protein